MSMRAQCDSVVVMVHGFHRRSIRSDLPEETGDGSRQDRAPERIDPRYA